MTEEPEPSGRAGRTPIGRTPGTPCWVSLMVHDVAATQAFYADLFGWEFQPGPSRLGPYVRALLGGQEVAGIGRLPADLRLPVAWTPYLASDDVDLTAERVRMCGGTVGVGPLDAGEAGRLAIGSDPSGAVFGVWQTADRHGTDLGAGPGTPAWNELRTFETANVAKFYGTLFGYEEERTASDDPAGTDHVTLRLDGRPVAGIHGLGQALPRDRGPHWTTYFEVTDPDSALDRVTGLGGRALAAARDTARGRVALAADPEGARFALIRSRPAADGHSGG
ncbi:VOC family protein [Streptomyces sp. NPDC047017]|uniref:VOC family protein n=1 Tax=Streptomyces sp. NPDC047017 TaxID=3155024 RepID=UPI0033D94FF0